jgi:hypothetical protein
MHEPSGAHRGNPASAQTGQTGRIGLAEGQRRLSQPLYDVVFEQTGVKLMRYSVR